MTENNPIPAHYPSLLDEMEQQARLLNLPIPVEKEALT